MLPEAEAATIEALRHVGEPYRWGGEGENGFDCSGLMRVAWLTSGRNLPHNSGMQFLATARVAVADVQPGDLVFFGDPIHHVGLYVGDGKMVEAPREGKPVRVSSTNRRDLVAIGRVR